LRFGNVLPLCRVHYLPQVKRSNVAARTLESRKNQGFSPQPNRRVQVKSIKLTPILLASAVAAAFTLISAPVAFNGTAFAQDGPKGTAAKGPSGDHGERGTKAPSEVGGRGQGQGGPDSTSDAKGPRFGGDGSKPTAGTQGGRPAWAGGTVDDVELGRLNVARAPSHVLDRALAEALATMDPALYTLPTLQAVIDAIKAGTLVRVDSPLANLALYKDMVLDNVIGDGSMVPVTADNYVLLAAIFIGGASDKTLPITVETVTAVNTILGLVLPSTVTVDQVAVAAEAVRVVILEVHGE
jgi:hypothetical protein